MKSVQASCPSCAAPVEFLIRTSLTTVCEFCSSVVARTDKKLEDRGKVADIVETSTPLHIGMGGKHDGKRFEIVGRIQYKHSAGGVWNEWYLAFTTGKWGWLAEAQGKLYLTFQKKMSSKGAVPPIDSLEVGRRFETKVGELVVEELGQATVVAAEGEMPFVFTPNTAHSFADLSGPDGAYATFDYSEQELVIYLGHEVSFDDLGISKDAVAPESAPKLVSSVSVNCPQCAGPFTMHVPDQAERLVCPSCAGMLDVSEGKLKYLQKIKWGKRQPVIPIGTEGTLFGTKYTVIGFVHKTTRDSGMTYHWCEYLLYEARAGFRWLVHSDNHWNFLVPIAAGEVRDSGMSATYKGKRFQLFDRGKARVKFVLGEFYWRVEVGEETKTRDLIAPPEMLSVEETIVTTSKSATSKSAASDAPIFEGEISYTHGRYVTRPEIEEAFGVKDLRASWVIGPTQPSPVDRAVYRSWWRIVLLLCALDFVIAVVLSKKVDHWFLFWAIVMVSVIPIGTAIYGSTVEKSRWANSDYSPYE